MCIRDSLTILLYTVSRVTPAPTGLIALDTGLTVIMVLLVLLLIVLVLTVLAIAFSKKKKLQKWASSKGYINASREYKPGRLAINLWCTLINKIDYFKK